MTVNPAISYALLDQLQPNSPYFNSWETAIWNILATGACVPPSSLEHIAGCSQSITMLCSSF